MLMFKGFSFSRFRVFSVITFFVIALIYLFYAVSIEYPAANGSEPGAFFICSRHPLSDSNLQYVANHYDFLIDDESGMLDAGHLNKEQISDLRLINPDLKILKWMSLLQVKDDIPNPAYETYSWSDIDENHPEWFSLGETGNRVKFFGTSNKYVMKPSSQGWRTHIASKANNYISSYGYDGIFLDFALPFVYSGPGYFDSIPVNPKTGLIYTSKEWEQDIAGALEFIKQEAGSKLVVVNGVGEGNTYSRIGQDWLDYVDGVMMEGFLRWSSDPIDEFRSETLWKKDVDAVSTISSKGKIILVMTRAFSRDPDSLKKPIELYAFASFLLGIKGNQEYFSFDRFYENTQYAQISEELNLQLGSPMEAYVFQDGAYQREFANGKVLVNPNPNNTFTIQLGNLFEDSEGSIVSAIELPPHTGSILIKHANSVTTEPTTDSGFNSNGGSNSDVSSGGGSAGSGSSIGGSIGGSGSSGGSGGSASSSGSGGSESGSSSATSGSQGEGIIAGCILNSANQVIPNATISINNIEITYDLRDGHFIAGKIPSGVYPVLYNAPGFDGQVQMIEIKTGQTTQCPNCLLSPANANSTICGRILDSKRQRSIPGATVRIDNSTTPTNAAGEFRFTGVVPGQYQIFYQAPYYKSQIQIITVRQNFTENCPTVMLSK